MDQDSYRPQPMNFAGRELPPELEPLMEKLAESIHDVWAAGRFKEGWTYGPKRDDAAKTNPCLVPYGQLPDSEKEYDRNTGKATLLGILELGYKIVPGK